MAATCDRFVRSGAVGSLIMLMSGISYGAVQPYKDVPFRQDESVRYKNRVDLKDMTLRTVRADRDGKVLVATDKGLLWVCGGELAWFNQYAGLVNQDHRDLELMQGKFVFLTDKHFLPLHWAGKDYRHNGDKGYQRVGVAAPGHYLLLSDKTITEIRAGEEAEKPNEGYREAVALGEDGGFVLYAGDRLGVYKDGAIRALPKPEGEIRGLVALSADTVVLATDKGLYAATLKDGTVRPHGPTLPWDELTCITRDRAGRLWIGSTQGAFSLDDQGKISYYAGGRWIQNNHVVDIHVDPADNVYILTKGGLARIEFRMMTLEDKARYYLRGLREHAVRYGMVSDFHCENGDPSTVRLHDSDNDGLWTGIYLAAEAFRYAVTKEPDALANAMDAFDALERLESINSLGGFQARSFELHGFKVSDPDRWRERPEKDWEWKGHTSSDEIDGTFFAHSIVYETIGKDFPDVRQRASTLVGKIMDHIVDHNLFLVDVDGKPTLWGKWNPLYINSGLIGGDRRLNSIGILSYLQLAYKMTGREKFKNEFERLVTKFGYAKNTVNWLPDPKRFWNHSDDELYWLSYYNLLKYCFDDSLRETFLQSIDTHYNVTRRKKNPVWNQIYGAVTGRDFDLDGPMWILREFPMDLRDWRMQNSHRKDIKLERQSFRRRQLVETDPVLPPDERRMHKWNSNEMEPDGGGSGNGGESGAEYLLPYWMGRYYGFISPPQR